MKNLVVGILAHVDAGKTTLSEGLLFASGAIGRQGRVDKRDSFLDTFSLERERGITIFSKQAVISTADTHITLIDTPGHVDFSCEAERAIEVQDYAILVINAQDGIQSHTRTIWSLLASRGVPTFIFVNKTDLSEKTRREHMTELRQGLTPLACDFTTPGITEEECAGADEELMREYFDTGAIRDSAIVDAIAERRVHPVFFGSALKSVGVKELLDGVVRYTKEKKHSERLFGAKVYKIGRDKLGRRMSYVKLTGGILRPKDTRSVKCPDGERIEEKVEEIRLYSGEKYKSVNEAVPGVVYAILGPTRTSAGMGLGVESTSDATLTPVLDYKMTLPEDVGAYEVFLKLSALAEEDPSLGIAYNERAGEIRVRLMGEIQLEVLKRLINERLGIEISFGEGSILYKETIAEQVRGAGHFEPLRHYAEVHLRLDPLPKGSGIVTDSDCSTDALSLNWQRLIRSHAEGRRHKGVLTGSPLTDVKITLTAGRAHQKHTEGGDFRQATFRAVRQALMKAKSVLLEPTFDFTIEAPSAYLGKIMTDLDDMHARSDAPEFSGDNALITGNCPVSTMRSYATRLRALSRGEGRLTMRIGPYAPCHNAEEVIAEIGYDPILDERHTPNSVFCKNGSGYVVPWHEADALMHCESDEGTEEVQYAREAYRPREVGYRGTAAEDKELMAIFEATYGKIKPRRVAEKTENAAKEEKPKRSAAPRKKADNYVIIDGYNFIFSWDFLAKYAEAELALARDILVRLACNYSSFYKAKVIIVFDAYKREESEGADEKVNGVSVVYTRHAQTADAYMEKTTHTLAKDYNVRVVTNDYDEQLIILGAGGLRVSCKEFERELEALEDEMREIIGSIR